MKWPFQRVPDTRSVVSVSDPAALAGYLGAGAANYSGVNVGETSTLGISAVYRAVSIISGQIASLPMKTYRDIDENQRQQVTSWLDNPGGPDGPTKFEWVETVVLHLLLHGNAYLLHIYNQGGALIGALPIHPLAVGIEERTDVPGRKLFRVTLDDGTTRVFDSTNLTHIPGPSLDGVRGLSVITVARNSLGTTIAGDRAASRMFSNGAMISGLATPDEDIPEDEAREIKKGLERKLNGYENAGDVALVNRKLNFTPWAMSSADAQFLESRQFQIEEIARWFGVPPHLIMQVEKQTSWGSGVAEQNRGLSRTVLGPWATRIEQRLSRLLPSPRFVEFEFAGLERPTPEVEIPLLIKQVEAGLITVNEARRIRNMDPIPGGDELRTTSTPQEPAEVAP